MKNICIVGASGKLGQYMIQHALDRGYKVIGVCREKSIGKLSRFEDRIEIVPGMTNDPEVIKRAVKGCEGVLTVLVPWGQILRLRRGNLDLPLDGDTSFAGGTECLRATGSSKDDGQGHLVFQGGQVIPTIVELTTPIRVSSIVPYGQSRRPTSPHYVDQAHLFSEGRMRPAWHTWSQLHDHVKNKKVIEYQGKGS